MTEVREPSFMKGSVISFLILSSSIPMVFIPLVGAFLSLSLSPYLAGAIGARFAHPRERIPLTLTCSITWSILETIIVMAGAYLLARNTPMGLVLDTFGLFILAMIWLSNIIFMLLGTFHPWNDPFSSLK